MGGAGAIEKGNARHAAQTTAIAATVSHEGECGRKGPAIRQSSSMCLRTFWAPWKMAWMITVPSAATA